MRAEETDEKKGEKANDFCFLVKNDDKSTYTYWNRNRVLEGAISFHVRSCIRTWENG